MARDRVTVVGNGVIGSLTALMLAREGFDVVLSGPPDRHGSASLAAGAMLNVYGEIDGRLDEYGRRKLAIGLDGIKAWRELLPADVFVADRTEVYLKLYHTDHERAAFEAIARAAGQTESVERWIQKPWTLPLENEPAIDTRAMFAWLGAELEAAGVGYWRNATGGKTVYCTGAFPNEVTPRCLPVFYGIGTAMHIEGAAIELPLRTVVRTPNRGNTCGVHVVPRHDGIYVGAGSYVSRTPQYGPRLETIKYLTDCLLSDFKCDIWRATVQPLVGFRPMSLDGKPMLGPLKDDPNVYVATGTKRDGLTYAPVVAQDIVAWAKGEKRSGVFDGWEPDRKPISHGYLDHSDVYINNRIAAMAEHGRKIGYETCLEELVAAEKKARAEFNLPGGFGLHPEIVGIFQ